MNEDRATRYHRLKRKVSLASLAWSAVLLGGLLATGLTVSLRDAVGSSVLAYVVALSALNEIGSLPLAFYSGFVVEHRYGLSNESFGSWVFDQAKSFALGLVLALGGVGLIYFFIRLSPERWWMMAGGVFALIIVGLTILVPVLLLPLFYSVKPLERDSLKARLLALAERAGARVLGAYEWGLGEKTKKANAALAGIGNTRRILVSDTMLADYSDEEIEVVLAHEMAHHVHGDIWKGIVFEVGLVLGGFYLAALALPGFGGRMGLQGAADPAGLPLLLLVAGALSMVMVPIAYAMSRGFERSADRFALQLTKNPAAFISAMRRLGAQNLAEDNPPKVVQWLFYTHPPLRERIAAAERYRS